MYRFPSLFILSAKTLFGLLDVEYYLFDSALNTSILKWKNRWGELIFEATDHNEVWDGTYNSRLVQQGIYIWKINFRDPVSHKNVKKAGHVTVTY